MIPITGIYKWKITFACKLGKYDICSWESLSTGLMGVWVWLGQGILLLHYQDTVPTRSSCTTLTLSKPKGSSLNGLCNAYFIYLRGVWLHLALSLTCNGNVPLKEPMPVKKPWIHHELALWVSHLLSYLHSFLVLQWKSLFYI